MGTNDTNKIADEAETLPEATRLLEIIQSLNDSDIPRLSIEEIEELLGRELGGIAEAYGETGIVR